MKFVHVSICFIVSVAFFGADGESPPALSGLSKYGQENPVGKYLDEMFHGKLTNERLKTIHLQFRKTYASKGVYLNASGDYCDSASSSPNSQLPEKYKELEILDKDFYVELEARKRKTEEKFGARGSGKCQAGWCCSGHFAKNFQDAEYCSCKPKGAPVGKNAGLNCCSQYAVLKDGVAVCGGIPPLGVNQPRFTSTSDLAATLFPLRKSDCMFPSSGTVDEKSDRLKTWRHATPQACARRKCQRFGSRTTEERDICCGGTEGDKEWDRPAPDKGTACGCGHSGAELSPYTTAEPSDCCSGSFLEKNSRKCGCIADHMEKPASAYDVDCCSGRTVSRYNKTWCAAANCTEQGKVIQQNGSHCCARNSTNITYALDKPCGCVWGGHTVYDNLASRCCSKQFNKDNKTCAWIGPDVPIRPWFNETECFSKEGISLVTGQNSSRVCTCMAPFSTLRSKDVIVQNPMHCCSRYTIKDSSSPYNGLCGCIKMGGKLGTGSDESHCCSGKAENGYCVCAEPGGRFSKGEGMSASDCCSGRAGEKFCLCSLANEDDAGACCAEMDTDGNCPCIPDGHLVPTSERADAGKVCCTKPSKPKCSVTCGD